MLPFSKDERVAVEEFVHHFAGIKRIRETFGILYEDEGHKKVLERVAFDFFADISVILNHFLILSYARLLDPAEDRRGNKNLTLDYFIQMREWDHETDRRIKDLDSKIKSFRTFVKEPRDKIIGHNDRETYLNQLEIGGFTKGMDLEFLGNVEALLSIIYEHAFGESFGEIVAKQEGGGGDLINYLIRGIAFDQMMMNPKTEADLILKMNNYLDNAIDGKDEITQSVFSTGKRESICLILVGRVRSILTCLKKWMKGK